MRTIMLFLICAATFSLSAFGKDASPEVIKIDVPAIDCLGCAGSIKQAFKDVAQVDRVYVSVEKKQVLLSEKKGQSLSDAEINAQLKNAGYEATKIERVPKAFDDEKKSLSGK